MRGDATLATIDERDKEAPDWMIKVFFFARVGAAQGHTAIDYEFYWNGPFSQWFAARIEIDGVTFNCAEQAMMYFKAQLFADGETAARILEATEPGAQKALAREVRGFSEEVWAAERFDIVRRINDAKFRQNKGLRRKLFQTGNRRLVEASPLDTIWGMGLDAATARETPPEDWPGQNLLGKALTEVKEALAVEFPEEAEGVLR